jgi:phosphopantothenoylcysteine decarboxylase/phosphopantothenate--cysteine ligase
MSPSNLLLILGGSIACYKACDVISQLVQRGHRVRVVATASALRFVGASTLEGLTGMKVGTDLFEPGAALDHIALARWADATLVCPATASLLNRMAAGLGDDLAGALLLAHDWKKPLLVAPAMNPLMWSHPATVASVSRLRSWGARFVAVGVGRTACGEEGEGRLAEPAEIVAAISAALARPERRLRVLITSGGTSEPIDGVRVITNTSTGETGALIASYFARRGHEVLLVRATTARSTGGVCREATFFTYADLDAALTESLRNENFDTVIHAAAVGDFSVATIEINGVARAPGTAKLGSDVAPVLRLRRNPKILDTLRARSRNSGVRVVGFKLTQEADPVSAQAAVQTLFATGAVDHVVYNDLAARQANGQFPAEIWTAGQTDPQCCLDRLALAAGLEALLVAERSAEKKAGPTTGPRRDESDRE